VEFKLKDRWPTGKFGDPASPGDVQEAEARLKIRLPSSLGNLYAEANGFLEPLGHAPYLEPLMPNERGTSLVEGTEFWWSCSQVGYPAELEEMFRDFLFFGRSSGDEQWAIRWNGSPELLSYHHSMGNEPLMMGGTILELFASDFTLYPAN